MDLSQREKLKKDLQISEDLLPTKQEERAWKAGNFASIWMGSVHHVPAYASIGGFFVLGLSAIQVFWVIMVAAAILAFVLIINGHAGAKYGIPYSMLLKTSYGIKGAVLPGLLRGCIAAFMWFGLQTYAGSTAVTILISKFWPAYLQLGGDFRFFGMDLPGLISFTIFWMINVLFIFGGINILGKFAKILSLLIYIVFGGMAIWAIKLAGGIGPILDYTAKGIEGNSALVFMGCVTAILATWAAPITNVSDFTREARTAKDQIIGQSLGIVITYILFAVASISIIVGSEIAFGTPIWNVLDVVDRFDSSFAIILSIVTICLTTLSSNVTANIFPAGYQLAALFPKKLNFQTGGLITAILAFIIMPWKLMENSTSIFTFLGIIGGLLGPVIGVMLADYFIIRKKELNLFELYSEDGQYFYKNGFNPSAYIATIVAGGIALIGQFVPFFKPLYDISWFVGTFTAFGLYIILMKLTKKDLEKFVHTKLG
ncbi:allantoin permease [Metabacillus fastidiosus]|uniref:allantoin permease n=1 Tax=Metabacillus fastidiosus TaxID=1458 RepID=UPI002E1FCF2A|nr:NCS1 family nucleobase:cation symporter [Metabacillus fastidiosus]